MYDLSGTVSVFFAPGVSSYFNSLYFSAIIVYRVFRHENKFVVKLVHFGLQLVAFCVAVVGLKAAFDYHNSNNISNLYSLHSWCGLITIILFTTQVSFRKEMIHWFNKLASHSGGGGVVEVQ